MTSRPGPGIHESLQNRGSGVPPRTQAQRRASKPAHTLLHPDCIDPALDDERPAAHHAAHDAACPPPRGRPPLFYTTIAQYPLDFHPHGLPYQPSVNLPVPPRPGLVHLRDAAHQRRILPGGSGVKDAPKSGAPEVIVPPVYFPGGKPADLFPWTGNNAEDNLTETLVKAGVSNKPQIMNESNTARPSLINNLKNKSGLSTLSTLFVAVLEKRQQTGRLQTPNTFKPPPRLTLRDSTREQWLHDLANPNTGLRRLSRTIPHGLTGKVLLEQCLNKNIPLPRALWLAKCVGINELRAHKRKGQAGTVTWGRGWTSSVEQFIDGVIGTIGQGDWKPRITYALQLATHLYKEHLLDDDHFLDWIVDGLGSCPSERLFIWLLIVSVSHYWADVSCCRRRGRRLAESLLNQLDKIYRVEDVNPYLAVLHYLENTVIRLIATIPACLLLPTAWAKYSPLLVQLAERRNHPHVTQAVRRLEQRNSRLLQSSKNLPSASQTPAGRVYRILDSVDYNRPVRIEDLSLDCMEVVADAPRLIDILLRWACSCYREGSHRIYLATRLLRKWAHLGADVYDGILSHFHELTWVATGESSILFKIVAELVRSKTFATGRYLQWLIATGSIGHSTDLSSPTAWALRLITEIPLTGLPEQIRLLRSTLLRGTIHSAEQEQHALCYVEHMISQSLPALFGHCNAATRLNESELDKLSSTVKLELGIWLRQHVAQYAEVNQHVPTKDPSVEETAAVSLLTPLDFHVVRSYLERFGDLAILADIVGIAISSLDPGVLAAAADTLNYHSKSFRAIGAFDPLYTRIAARYLALRTVRYPDRELLLSLSNLTRPTQADSQLSQLLSYDLGQLTQRNSLAACSPASDNMGEVMQTGSSSDDEIERILSSGNSMDQQMMSRVLRKIVGNLEEHAAKGSVQLNNQHAWFHRLRCFDESTFDMVVNEWLILSLMAQRTETLRVALPTLVGSGCIALSSFLDAIRACVAKFKTNPSEGGFRSALKGMHIILPSETLVQCCSPQDAYRYRLEQRRLCMAAESRFTHCISEMIGLGSMLSSQKVHAQLSHLLCSKPVLFLLKHHIITDPGYLSKLNTDASSHYFKQSLDILLDPNSHLRLSEKDPENRIVSVFALASELSLPICQAALEQIFSSGVASPGSSHETLSATLLSAIRTAVEEDQPSGLELLASLDAALTEQIRQHAERELISASTFLTIPSNVKADEFELVSPTVIQKFLTVIDLTSSKRTDTTDQSALLQALIERFKGIAQALDNNRLSILDVYAWLSALLRLVVSHASAMLSNATHPHQTAMMSAMAALLTHQSLELYPTITEHIFDVTVYLSDYISDDVRFHVTRLEGMKLANDSRCVFILGVTAPVDGWLVLAKPVSTPMNQVTSQPPTPAPLQTQSTPYQSPQSSAAGQASPSPLSQMQQMQQMQQRAMQPSLAYSQRPTPAAGQVHMGSQGQMGGQAPGKPQMRQERDVRYYPFVQPRWEILAESSGNPTGNETAINLSLFGARKV
ncbi:Med12 multi-domain protein [Pyrenophora tritici-repentis]|nr:Med12 multi-domain protein [Pyrenophora tritici-repentis]KAI1550713.1 Med12 domain containing protein [Pyrenophora tritici-repentis]